MIHFILNNEEIETPAPAGTTLLDFIRYGQQLTGTKIGCREGDCGACTILVGEYKEDKLNYKSATSCLMPLGNAAGKHIVTVEGINLTGLNFVQESFVKMGASQCGFCTPGFIVSLTGHCLAEKKSTYEDAIDSINGNICRCTGYKSIEKAAAAIHQKLEQRENISSLAFSVQNGIVPSYFLGIKDRLKNLTVGTEQIHSPKKVGGGTDLYVQQHDTIVHEQNQYVLYDDTLKGISQKENKGILGASTVVAEMDDSPVFQQHFKDLKKYIKLVSSTPIRNMATIAGNFTNASPIGDLTIFFLALDTSLHLTDGNISRHLPLRDYYLGYKQLNKKAEEYIHEIQFELPGPDDLFNFEKVCKRTHLDIASVNTAIFLKMENGVIVSAGLSAGGVGPIPTFLIKSSQFLSGKKVSEALVLELIEMVQTEISPISDARGTETYKRLLLSQLIKAHFIKLFPSLNIQLLLAS